MGGTSAQQLVPYLQSALSAQTGGTQSPSMPPPHSGAGGLPPPSYGSVQDYMQQGMQPELTPQQKVAKISQALPPAMPPGMNPQQIAGLASYASLMSAIQKAYGP